MTKWEDEAKAVIKKSLKRFQKLAKEYQDAGVNEAQTRVLINGILTDLLGYDSYTDLSVEQMTHHDYMDYGVKIDGELRMIVEAKAINVKLTERHLEQVTNYALDDGVEWVVLTNGHIFRLYRITNGLPLTKDLILIFDILNEKTTAGDLADDLFYLSKPALKRGTPLIKRWKEVVSVSPSSIKEALLTRRVLGALRLQLKQSTGVLADTEALREQVLNLFSGNLT